MEKTIRKRNATPSDSDKQLNPSPAGSTRAAGRETQGEERSPKRGREGRKIRHFAPHNMHMPANMNPRDCSPSSGKNVDIRYFTSSSSSLWTFVPAASVSSSFLPSWTATTPPAPPPPHRPLNRRLPHGAPPPRREGRARAGARPAVAAPTPGDASRADSERFRAGGWREEGRKEEGGSSSLKLRETSRSAPLDFELRGSIARLPAKNSSNNFRMPIKGLARGGVAETNVCMQ